MSQFLVVVSKAPRCKLDPKVESTKQCELLSRVAKGYEVFLGLDYDTKPQIVTTSSRGTESLLFFKRLGSQGFENAEGEWWTITAGQDVSEALKNNLRVRNGRLSYKQPVWGQYAAVLGEKWNDRVTAWNTVPALEAIHWGEDCNHVYISNRPLLVALGLSGGNRKSVALSESYVTEYLAVGYSITGQSPFEGVVTIPVDRSLVVQSGLARMEQVPAGLDSSLDENHTLSEGADALADALIGGMDRVQAQLKNRPLQFRMSGGKDSRLLLGLLRNRGMNVKAVTFGNRNDIDVRLAHQLTSMVDIPHLVRQPEPLEADDEAGRIERALFEAGGIPISEPHTIRYRGSDVKCSGEAIMLGQWPLMKGGMAKRMLNKQHISLERVLVQLSPFINKKYRVGIEGWLKSWLEQVPASSELEKQYLFARQFRSGRYMHGHITHYERDAMIAYPISDHQVAAVCDALSMYEKVSEKALFGALSRIWPEVMSVPLDKSVWRFEASGPDPEWSGPNFEERYKAVPELEEEIDFVSTGAEEYSDKVAAELILGLKDDENLERFLPLLRDDVKDSILATTKDGGVRVPKGVIRGEYIKFLWRLRVISLWLTRSWIPDE